MDAQPRIRMRLATAADVGRVIREIGCDFFDESGFARFAEFDPERWEETCKRRIRAGSTPFIVAELQNSDIIGFVSYALEHSFTTRPIACLWMFYVYPAWRGTPVARALLTSAIDVARGDEACAFFATLFPTHRGGRTLFNLFRKFDFAPQGGALFRSL